MKTSTGIWNIVYNAENRPVTFTRNEEDGTETQVTCTYDSMGRRATRKVTTNGTVTLHQRYIYRDYLQIACCDLTRTNHPSLWLITWDPTQPIATRPLAIRKDGTWYCYGWDLTKNICEVFGSTGYIRTAYTYTPYGEVTSSGNTAQPLQWSSESYDDELGLVYYNFRHYNLSDGGWIVRDFEKGVQQQMNPYKFATNQPSLSTDYLGLDVLVRNTPSAAGCHWKICVTKWKKVDEGYKGDYCCWKKQKYVRSGDSYCIGFGPHQMYQMFPCSRSDSDTSSRHEYGNPKDGGTPMPPEMQNVNGVGANGVVTENNHPKDDRETGSQSHLPDIKTSCGEDMAILAHFEGQVQQTADYYFVGNKANCRWYAFYMYNYVIKNIINPGRTK